MINKNFIFRLTVVTFAVALPHCTLIVANDEAKDQARKSDSIAESSMDHDASMSSFLQGIVKPRKNASLRFSKAGIVSNVFVKEGDFVEMNTPLLETENQLEVSALKMAELDAKSDSAVEKARLDYELAGLRYQRILVAMKRGASTDTEVLEKKHALESARLTYEEQVESRKRFEIKLEMAKNDLESKTLKAPFKGQVLRLNHTLGNSVDFSTVAVVCADLSVLTVEMNLPAEQYGKIEEGSTRPLYAMTPVSCQLPARIVHVSSEIEPSSQTFRVTFEIDNQDLKLPSGFEVWFSQPKKQVAFGQSN